jgi:hypothetical protein
VAVTTATRKLPLPAVAELNAIVLELAPLVVKLALLD